MKRISVTGMEGKSRLSLMILVAIERQFTHVCVISNLICNYFALLFFIILYLFSYGIG